MPLHIQMVYLWTFLHIEKIENDIITDYNIFAVIILIIYYIYCYLTVVVVVVEVTDTSVCEQVYYLLRKKNVCYCLLFIVSYILVLLFYKFSLSLINDFYFWILTIYSVRVFICL